MKPATISVSRAAQWIGVSRALAYQQIRQTGEIVGVPVLVVGRRLLVPVGPLRRALGLEESDDET